MPLSSLSPQARKVYLAIIRQFAKDSGAAQVLGLERAEEAILHAIEVGKITLIYDRARDLITLEVKQ